jgi:DNA-binding SARP family transcriptional activator
VTEELKGESSEYRFTVLGPPTLSRGGVQVDLGAPQQQAVLMMLLVHRGTFVPSTDLADGLWGDRAPASGETVIRTYISRLRRLLSEQGVSATINHRSGGYLLNRDQILVDASEFAELIDAARRSRTAGDLSSACDHLVEALQLWTGTALAGVPGEAAERERVRLERLKLTAAKELLELRLELGEHAQVVAEAPLLIQLNPLEESLYEIYLLALYRSGRRAEALEAYRMLYDLLSKELGVRPGPGVQAVHEKILSGDADLDGPLAPSRGTADAVPGQPVQRLGQDGWPAADRPRSWTFVGRTAERSAFQMLMAEHLESGPRLVLVSGPVGIGKSTLLIRLVEDCALAGRQSWLLRGTAASDGEHELERVAAEMTAVRGAVLLLDCFEELNVPESWMRDHYLPELPDDCIVVMALEGRPIASWFTDPAWSGRADHWHLGELAVSEAAVLVEARGVDKGTGESVLDFAEGNPFALALAAEVGRTVASATPAERAEAARYVIDQTVEKLAGRAPTAMHRKALHICAHARTTTEDLLRTVLQCDNASDLFDWLRNHPYVHPTRYGLELAGVLREALDDHLHWRDASGYREMHQRIRGYVMGKVLRDSDQPHARMEAMRAIGHLRRRGGATGRYLSLAGDDDLVAAGATPADADELVALAREGYGESTASSVRYWLDHQPEAFYLLRCRKTHRLRGFMSWLVLTEPDQADLDADQVIAEVWEDVSRRMQLPSGTHIAIARHLIRPPGEGRPSPVTEVLQARVLRSWLHEEGLAASYLVSANAPLWRSWMQYQGLFELDHTSLDHPGAIFGHDWLAVPPDQWKNDHLAEELETRASSALFAPRA